MSSFAWSPDGASIAFTATEPKSNAVKDRDGKYGEFQVVERDYRMSILSSYLDPPPGAPLACKSLGTVTFDDMADNKHIVGPKADQTWTDISKHIHVRELTDALAAARRAMAEAPPPQEIDGKIVDLRSSAFRHYEELAERAKKWGIAARMPPEQSTSPPPQAAPSVPAIDLVAKAQTELGGMTPVHMIGEPAPASRDAPWLGAPIVFITNPGEQIGGMQEIVGWCVKIHSHDRISIFMTPDHSEPSYRDNLPRRGSPAGNGRVHQFNTWDFNPEALRQRRGIDEMFLAMTRLVDRIEALERPRDAEEAPRRRGRPPKASALDDQAALSAQHAQDSVKQKR